MNEKIYVVYCKHQYEVEYLCKVEPYHEWTSNKNEAKKFTLAQARKIWLPLHNSEVSYRGYSTYGYGV